ncbi:YfcE family phosphodiesterase [Flavobacteriaceae bacterium Ap0902]|nr:YfcE family phosphodiesterase [Flavobacteriaceae bacterium Ap0902]
MKRILLLSDTHSYMDDRILHYASSNDEIWHAGDIGNIAVADALAALKPFRAVYGNIDGTEVRNSFPLNLIFELEGIKVFMTHIAGYPGKYNTRVKEQIIMHSPKLVICGHSHILKVMPDKNLNHLHMNPGAAGIHGFHQMRTMLQFELNEGNIENLSVIELGKRGSPPNQ